MWLFPLRFRPGSDRALITLPSARRPVLMYTDSLRRVPVLPVFPARSDPARSTRQSLEERTDFEKDRLDFSFIPVVPVWRRAFPISNTLRSSSAEETVTSLAPTTTANTQNNTKTCCHWENL
uniref:Uncharacterized protein n=1 Tax=Sphaeramia orbicularis TaxID=375764 RepID=A0A673C3I1_9TELE